MRKSIVKRGVRKKAVRNSVRKKDSKKTLSKKKIVKKIVQKKIKIVKKKETPEDKRFGEAYELLMEYHEGYKVDLEKGGCCNED